MMNTVFAGANYSQPTFSLEFNIYGTGAEILLNDIPVYYHDAEGQTASQKPIPESIIDGENVLTVKTFTFEEDDYKYLPGAYLEAAITVREKDAPLNKGVSLLQLKLNLTNPKDKLFEGSVAKYGDKEPVILEYSDRHVLVERRTAIQSPFPRWAWQDGQVIEDTPENFDSLLAVYKEIWAALNEGDKACVQVLYDPAAQEFALAYHYQDKKHGHRIMNTGGLINDDDWVLGDMSKIIDDAGFRLDINAHGRLVQITDEFDRTPIIYLNKNVEMLNIQKFGFYKNKAGEWVMIR